MDSTSLDSLAEDLLGQARAAHSGRAAHTVFGGTDHLMRQTVIALLSGQELSEHNNPGEATLHVLRGAVRLGSSSVTGEAGAGDFITIPSERHSLAALEDSVVMLSVVNR
jgi:quercetin dioxygenase-like cupin family protein